MSNIYDEALKEYNEVYFGAMPTVVKAIERAKKEHELLGLYRKLMSNIEKYDSCKTIQEKHDLLNDFNDIDKQIEQLEEELK